MAVSRIAAVLLVIACGCRPVTNLRPSWPDAPVALRDDTDRDAATDRLWILPAGRERDDLRASIAIAATRRMVEAAEADRPVIAAALLEQLTALWQDDPAALGAGLAPHADAIRELRARFARAGWLEHAALALVLLAELAPEHRADHLAELDEILAFADELAVAEHGPDAVRAQALQLLQPAAFAVPLPWLVDRYVALAVERQQVVSRLLDARGASFALVRAHHDILGTSRRIAGALARADRATEIHRVLARMNGIGVDRELTVRAEVVAEQPTAEAFVALAAALRDDEHAPDPGGALAVARAGLVRFPSDPQLLVAAAGDARTLGRIDQAIQLYEAAVRAGELDTALALRLGKLYGERIARLAGNGRPGAAEAAWRDVEAFVGGQQPRAAWQQTAALAESALGRGLASQGLVDAGRRALVDSLDHAPSIDAYETLAQIDVQVDRYRDAQRWIAHGLALLGDATTGDRYRRAKLERIAGDAHRRAGHAKQASASYLDALRTWASLGEPEDLPRGVVAERMLDTGRAMWWLGEAPRALELLARAVDHDPGAPAIAAAAVAFLIEAGRYREALDAYHRALGTPGASELYKVYMSLWIAAEARRLGEPRDRLASEYLASQRGEAWHELLARAASGELPFEALRAAANTGPRRGELAFYGAALGLDPAAATPEGHRRLLEQAIDARVVLDAEYDFARMQLAAPEPGGARGAR
ncbi:MAG: hypothetical protein ACTHU0_31420 [Kofleriaceae bacterium]